MNKQKLEKAAQIFFLANALLAVVSVLAIAVFILIKGMTPFVSGQYSLFSFLAAKARSIWRVLHAGGVHLVNSGSYPFSHPAGNLHSHLYFAICQA